jgi:hypothetical protein
MRFTRLHLTSVSFDSYPSTPLTCINQSTNSLYEFNNIRYAEPPLKTRRFRHPIAPATVNRTVNDGSYGFACKQGLPRAKVVELSLPGEDVITARDRLIHNPVWNEDCLFLNVVVPKAVFPSQQCTARQPRATNKAKGCKCRRVIDSKDLC